MRITAARFAAFAWTLLFGALASNATAATLAVDIVVRGGTLVRRR